MKIYIIEWRTAQNDPAFEVLPVAYCSAEAAKRVAESRASFRGPWQEHNSHGLCWISTDHTYCVSELELVNS